MSGDFFVHESSYIDEGVTIGRGTKIWHFCHILPNATIGDGCNIGQNVMIDKGVKIGNFCKIQNNVSIYQGVELDDGVFLGPSCVFTNVINPRAQIEKKHEFKPTKIGRGATIGANATIICGVKIGQYAMVGAGALVRTDIPDYGLVVGNPARLIGYVDEQGNTIRKP